MTQGPGNDAEFEGEGDAQGQAPHLPSDARPSAVASEPKPPVFVGVTLQTNFAGRRGRLFRLALKTSFLTVLTLGFYRFWMKTRLRRYYWSSIRPGGTPLEYVGEPMEKLLGFLIAVVFLAFYIGIANLILMFLSFSILGGSFAAYAVSFIGVIPILFYAQYRARRYILGRTRWRGIRFGVEPAAWGYTWRALGHWSITILTLGLLWPRMTFWLEKYRTDRTHYGTAQMHQDGRWTMLYPPFLPLLLGVLLGGIAFALGTWVEPGAFWVVILAMPLTLYGWVNYLVESFRLLTNAKTADGIGFQAKPRRWRVLRIYVFGTLLIYLGLLLLVMAFGLAIVAGLAGVAEQLSDAGYITGMMMAIPGWARAALAAILYFSFFILWGVLTQIFLTLPLIRHYAETLELTGAASLAGVAQRDRDTFAEAEGFAEALDVGAAI